jgi:Fe-S oxidoreductase
VLTPIERILFFLLIVVFGGLAAVGFYGIYNIVRHGRSAPPRKGIVGHLLKAFIEVGLQIPMFRSRRVLSVFHAFIFFGFSFYFLVNVVDVLEGFVPGFSLLYGGEEWLGTANPAINLFNLTADILSVLTLLGMIVFLVRRFLAHDKRLDFNEGVLLNPKVKKGWIKLDSLIVGVFILIHVGSRFTGQAVRLAENGQSDPFMPFASLYAGLFTGLSESATTTLLHITWWLAIGLVVVFLPYFIRSKHVHLMIAPLNIGLGKQTPHGQLDPAAPEGVGDNVEPGAAILEDLSWPRLLDGYACIMCNRCNDVCPAHSQGSVLSPAALEVNKRYLCNDEFKLLARGAPSPSQLIETVISPEAVWACTTCYACVRVCPVGNEPMADIIDIRRRMIIEGAEIDSGIQTSLESLAKNGNWFGKGSRGRARWAKGLDFKIKDVTKEEAEYLWFVGDTAAFDARVVPLTQKVAAILRQAGVDYGTLGRLEQNSGNDVRRVGEEGLFEQLVENNMDALGKGQFRQIMTTDPHSLNALRNEYPQYGGRWPVHHYSNVLLQLFESGQLTVKNKLTHYRATYHDPCYLGRYNGGYAAPRQLLEILGVNMTEMPRHKENSYCCGAGGGQIWLGMTPEGERPAENRIREALTVLPPSANGAGPAIFVVACPKDVIMYTDAVKTTENEGNIEVKDIIELVVEAIGGIEVEEVQELEVEG